MRSGGVIMICTMAVMLLLGCMGSGQGWVGGNDAASRLNEDIGMSKGCTGLRWTCLKFSKALSAGFTLTN